MHNIDAEGRHEPDANAVRCHGCSSTEGIEGAAVGTDGEEGFVHAAAMEDEAVPGKLAGREVACFEVELGDGAEQVECV